MDSFTLFTREIYSIMTIRMVENLNAKLKYAKYLLVLQLVEELRNFKNGLKLINNKQYQYQLNLPCGLMENFVQSIMCYQYIR